MDETAAETLVRKAAKNRGTREPACPRQRHIKRAGSLEVCKRSLERVTVEGLAKMFSVWCR